MIETYLIIDLANAPRHCLQPILEPSLKGRAEWVLALRNLGAQKRKRDEDDILGRNQYFFLENIFHFQFSGL